jgi:hypothetical protein
MSLARKHRDAMMAALAAKSEPAVAPVVAGGLTPDTTPPSAGAPARPSLARAARDRALSQASASAERAVAPELDAGTPEQRAAAQMQLRLQHDLRRLKDIQSIEKKIEAKREMLPEYAAWVEGLVAADAPTTDEVLPTVMIWRIDTGDFAGALTLAEHVLAHDVPLPARYERTAPALIVEEIATAALKAQGAGESFALEILERVAELTADADMHDEIRAKLAKAIGVEQMRAAEDGAAEPLAQASAAAIALGTLRRAQQLNERVGVKDRIKRLEKMLAPPKEPAAAAA